MVTILTRLNHFIGVEMLFVMVDGLLGPIIPTGIDPFFAFWVLPRTVDLCHDGLRDIVRVLDVNPVANFPHLTLVEDTVWQRKTPVLHQILAIGLFLFELSEFARFHLQVDGISVYLAFRLIVSLGVVEHQVHVSHEVIDRLILLPFRLSLDEVDCNRLFDFHVVVRISSLVWQSLKVSHFQLATGIFQLPNPLQDCLDPGLHRGVHTRRPASLLPHLRLFLAVVFSIALGLRATLFLMATFIIGIVFVIIVIVFLLLFLLLRKRIRVGNLSEIRQLSLLGSNYSLLGQLIELLGENILYLEISMCSPH